MNIKEAFLERGLSWPPDWDEIIAYREYIVEKATKQMEIMEACRRKS